MLFGEDEKPSLREWNRRDGTFSSTAFFAHCRRISSFPDAISPLPFFLHLAENSIPPPPSILCTFTG